MRSLEAITLHSLGAVDSTNDEAKRRALADPQHGLMFTATAQSKGRGSHNREWISPAGNLYASLLLLPEIEHAEALSFVKMAGLAVVDVLQKLKVKSRLKAPNDVLVNGKKICGILVETVTKGSKPPAVVVGIGLNIASYPNIPSYPATSLQVHIPKPPPLPEVTAFLAESLRNRYESWRLNGFTPMEEEYHAACD